MSAKKLKKRRIERFGERAVRMGFVTRAQVAEALRLQKDLSASGKEHKLIGFILLETGALTNDQLIEVLETYEDEADDIVL